MSDSGGGAAAAVPSEAISPNTQAGAGSRAGFHARAFDLLRWVVMACFCVVFVLACSAQDWGSASALSVLVFLGIALASELLPVTLPDNAEITLTPILMWAVVALFGPGYGVVTAFSAAFLGSLLYKQLISRSANAREGFWQYLLYNSCIIGTNAGIGALIYHGLGGIQMYGADLQSISLGQVIWPLLVATFVALAMDIFFYAVGSAVAEMAEDDDASLEALWMRAKVIFFKNAFAFIPSYVMFTPFAFVLAYLFEWRGLGFWGVLPILVPFFSVRHTLNLLMAQIRTYRQTVTTLATLMQKYHPYTRGHLKRVADLSVRLARELRLPAASQQWIWEAGLLHDIGKVGVSEQILDKTETLTDDEWAAIKAHPGKSAEIITQLDFLDNIIPWVKYHHERSDGKGYPDNLTEDDIPLEAAIIAVADAFDAMTGTRGVADGKSRTQCDACEWQPSNGDAMPEDCPECGASLTRVYRKPMTPEDGIKQLRYGVGTQFSAKVVRGMIRVMAKEDQTQ